jgi:ATP-dependent DNA helicase RecQ
MSTLNLSSKIIELFKKNKSLSSSEISQFLLANEKDILIHLRQLLTDDKIKINHQNKYQLNI